MKRLVLAIGIALLAACLVASSAPAAGLQVTFANSKFPQRALVVSESTPTPLSTQNVQVLENGAPARGVSVRSLRQASANDFGVVLVIDVSADVPSIEKAIAAARGLAADRPAQGMLGIVEADGSPPITLGLTRQPRAIDRVLAKTPSVSKHGLHIYNAVMVGIQMLRNAGVAAPSVIVLSDGADLGDPATLKQLVATAKGGNIKVFSVGIANARFNPQALTTLARKTGGQFVEAGTAQLSQIATDLESRLSDQYLIRYSSTEPLGETVNLVVRVKGVGSVATSYASPTLLPGISVKPAHVHSTFWTSAGAVVVIAFACALLIGFAVHRLMTRRRNVANRVGDFVVGSLDPEPRTERTLVQRALGEPGRRRANEAPWLAKLAFEAEIAGLNVSPTRLLILSVAGGVLLAVLLVRATSSALSAPLGLSFPLFVVYGVRYLANRQRRMFDEQLPDNLQVVASALRAGHTFVGSLGVVVEDAPEPSRRELRRALSDESLGIPLADALGGVSERMQSNDFRQVALVATLQRDTGGNTAEVIDVVTDTIRDRLDLRRLIRTLTAQGRLAGVILSALPVVLLLAVSLINPHYVRPLFHKPAGIIALIVAIVMVIAGTVSIQKIVDIEV